MKKTIFLLLFLIYLFTPQIYPQWTQTNGPAGGYVYSLAAGPDGPGGTRIFIGTENGIYISTDNGNSWKTVNSGLPDGRCINALIASGSKVLAGTNSSGVYLSTDNGNNWIEASSGLPEDLWGYLSISSIAVQGTNIFAGFFSRGVYRSTNDGKNWTAVNSGLPENSAISCFTVMGKYVFTAANGSVYLSTDSGTNWRAATSGFNSGLPENEYIQYLTASSTNVFAGTSANGIYMLASDGSVWSEANSGLPKDSLGQIYFYDLASNGTNIFASANSGIYLSSDNGSSWKKTSFGLTEGLVAYKMGVSGTNVYAGTPEGVYVSSDNGANWHISNAGFIETDIRGLALNGSNIFASDGREVYLSTDNGQDWHTIYSWPPKAYIMLECLAADEKGAYLGGAYSIKGSNVSHPLLLFYKDTSWTDLSPALPEHTFVRVIKIISGKIFAGIFYENYDTSSVLVSTDNGISWTKGYSGLPFVNDLAVIGNNIFAGTKNGIYLSVNNGKSWTNVGSELPKNEYSEITALAVCDSHLVAATIRGRVYFSSDYGASWTASAPALSSIRSLAVSGNYVLARNKKGRVFMTSDYGKTYIDISSGLPASIEYYNTDALAASETYIFAASCSGVWRRPLSELADVKDKASAPSTVKFMLEQNYPNPFNPVTAISCTLPSDCKVKLSVFNLLGEEIRLLIDRPLKAGSYKVTFNADGLPSGVYFYQLKAGNYIETKKMILLR